MTWDAFPLAIARTAGFDYDVLGRLADPALLDDGTGVAGPGGGGTGEAADRHARACAAARAGLADVLGDERVREGIAVLAPDVLRWTARRVHADRDGDPDKHERKLVLFLQRLAAKCDTNAIAGTVGYAALGPGVDDLLPSTPRRRGFVAHWVLGELLLQRAAADLAARRPVPGPALALLDPARARSIDRRVRDADSWAQVRERGAATDDRTVLTLHRRGLVWSAPVLPVAEPDAAAAARSEDGHGFPELERCADDYAQGHAAAKLQALHRAETWVAEQGLTEVRRGAGAVYRDRTVLYAEHYEPVPAWPAGLAGSVARTLDPALDLACAVGVWARERAREAALPGFAALAAGRDRVPLAEVLRELPAGYPVDLPSAGPARAVARMVAEQAGGDDVIPVVLDPDAVRAACAPWLEGAGSPLLASPDVFLGDDGEVVLGEVHAGLTVFGNLLVFVDDRPELVARARTWLAERDPRTSRLVNVAMGQRFGKVCHLEVMPRTLELTGRAAAGRRVLSADDLEVDGALRVRLGDEPVELSLASGEGDVASPFGPPAARQPTLRTPGARRMPRIAVGRCVLQRATWWFPLSELAGLGRGRAAVRHAGLRDLARSHGLPRWTFVRVPGEPKPVHLDLANPILTDAVVRMLARAVDDGPEVRITEMLPRPGDDRMREFRMSCVRPPGSPAAPREENA